MINIYMVKEDPSEDGRGGYRPVAAFLKSKDAMEAEKKLPSFRYHATQIETIEVYESVMEFTNARSNKIKQKALAKLTSEERAELGL